MSEVLDRGSMKRLMAYSAAAGLGAFAFAPGAQAAVQTNNAVNGLNNVYGTLGPNVDIITPLDIDNDGNNDVLYVTALNGAQALVGAAGTTIFSDNGTSVDPLSYYVFGFQTGDNVDAGARGAGGGANLTYITHNFGNPVTDPVNPGYYLYYHFVADGDWVGVSFDIGGNTHFGAIEILQQSGHRASPNGTVSTVDEINNNPNPINTTLGRMIWEDQAGTTLVIPEPASLALLAAGAGAMGLRRRRKA